MSKKQILFGVLGIGIALIFFFTLAQRAADSSENISPEQYANQLETERSAKNSFFKTSTDSPIPDKANFSGLSYFPPDLTYRIQARLEPFADKTQKMVIKLSDGSEEIYEKYAHAVFSLQGTVYRLLLVKQNGNLSILFRDATSNKETYGGGRYIDLAEKDIQENQVTIDFNSAYNPYCAYNQNYACPFPPAENTLPIPIRAGEKYNH